MILSALRTLLVPAIGGAALPEAGYASTGEATITLPAIAAATQKETAPAFGVAATSLSKHHCADGRHIGWQAALDIGGNFVAG
jgi:hypothetical protein